MDDRRELLAALAWRVLLATPFALAAWWLFASSAGDPGGAGKRLLGLVGVVVAAIIVGRGLAGLVAEPAGGLFHPRQVATPEPCRSIAETRRARGHYEEAIAAYEEVTDEFPADVESWIAMVEIAFVHLGDGDRGDALARRALLALRDDRSRRQLLYAHRAARGRLAEAEASVAST